MTSNTKVVARKLPGFRDFFADEIQIREFVMYTFKQVFEKYGYEPLETPALEYTEIFAGEAGEEAEKLFFKFKDTGDRSVMLKYEVMISMCRAVAENIDKIILPYKRYQIQPVWRAEKPQKGRYREFTQCDADTIGSKSVVWDAEFIQMGIEAMQKLGFAKFRANVSNRKFLNGLVSYAGGQDKDFIPICLSIDKLPKIGKEAVLKELLEVRKISRETAEKVLYIVTKTGDTQTLLNGFMNEFNNIPVAQEGLTELKQIFDYLQLVNLDKNTYRFSPFIARGLAYYTGPIWEFEIMDGDVGSVAGCGRYDNTIGRFLGKQIPATGGSFGIERLVEVIKDRQLIKINPTKTQVLVTIFNEQLFNDAVRIADTLRNKGIRAMLYSDPVKLDKQLKYADRKGIPYVVIAGPDETAQDKMILKDMRNKIQKVLTIEEVIRIIQ